MLEHSKSEIFTYRCDLCRGEITESSYELTLEELKDYGVVQISDGPSIACDKCARAVGLKDTKPTQVKQEPEQITVPGYGPKDCKIAIIGEVPETADLRMRKPFVGLDGKLLNELLLKAGIVRQACYIDNTIQVRPPRGYITSFLDTSKKIPYMSKEYYDGVESLRKNLEDCKANIIIALGNTPLFALTGRTGITKWRGSILESTLLPGRKVISTIHPGDALREYLWQRVIVTDLLRANRESNFSEIRRPSYTLEVLPSFERSISYLESTYLDSPVVAVDIEVSGSEVKCISFCSSEKHAISIPFTYGGNDYFNPRQEGQIWRLIAKILESPTITKIFQNGMFDLTFIYERYGIVPQNLDDTMVAHAICWPDYRHGLDFITSTYTEHPYYKDEGKIWNKLSYDEKAFFEYNARDSLICYEAMPKLMSDLQRQGNVETYKRQMGLTCPLMFIQSRGIRLDLAGMEAEKVKTSQQIEDLTTELQTKAGMALNPNSPKQLQGYFYVKLGHKPYTYKGKMTTDETAMKRLASKGVKEASTVLEIRKRTKLLGTYLDVTLDADKRMRGAFRVVGATSGRVSSSKTIFGTGGNLQNQPRKMKRFFLADEGYVCYSIDLSQAENRLVAYMAPEPSMIDAFENGKDVHSLTGALISGLSVDQVKQDHKTCEALLKEKRYEEAAKYCAPIGSGQFTWRFWGKKCNHGLNYGLGYKKFSLLCEIPEREGKMLTEAYHSAYPGVRQGYHAYVQAQLRDGRALVNPYGRKRFFLERWGEELFKDAYSFLPQSTVPDKMWKDAVCPVYYEEELQPIAMMNTVHDSLDFQISLEHSWEVHTSTINYLLQKLESPIIWRTSEIVIPCDIKMGLNLGTMEELKRPGSAQLITEQLQRGYEKLTEGEVAHGREAIV